VKDRIPVALLCLCALLVGGLLRPIMLPAAAQTSAAGPPVQAGRYSIAANSDTLYFADTQTGRLWFLNTGLVFNEKGVEKNVWRQMSSPPH
jgi:hypothetical protein